MTDFLVERAAGNTQIAASATTVALVPGTDYTAPADNTTGWFRITSSRRIGDNRSGGTLSGVDEITAGFDPSDLHATGVTLTRQTSDSAAIQFDWELPRFIGAAGLSTEWKVRLIEKITCTSGSNTVVGSAAGAVVDRTRCFVVILGQKPNSSGGGLTPNDVLFYPSQVDASKQVTFTRRRSHNVAADIAYAVVELTGSSWDLEYVTHDYNAGPDTPGTPTYVNLATDIPDITTAFTLFYFNPSTSTANNYEMGQEVWLERPAGAARMGFCLETSAHTSGAFTAGWVIRNSIATDAGTGAVAMNVQRKNGTFTTSADEAVAITSVGSLANAMIGGISARNSQGSGSPGRDTLSAKLTTTTNLQLYHKGMAGTTTWRAEIVTLPQAGSGAGVAASSTQLQHFPDPLSPLAGIH